MQWQTVQTETGVAFEVVFSTSYTQTFLISGSYMIWPMIRRATLISNYKYFFFANKAIIFSTDHTRKDLS